MSLFGIGEHQLDYIITGICRSGSRIFPFCRIYGTVPAAVTQFVIDRYAGNPRTDLCHIFLGLAVIRTPVISEIFRKSDADRSLNYFVDTITGNLVIAAAVRILTYKCKSIILPESINCGADYMICTDVFGCFTFKTEGENIRSAVSVINGIKAVSFKDMPSELFKRIAVGRALINDSYGNRAFSYPKAVFMDRIFYIVITE